MGQQVSLSTPLELISIVSNLSRARELSEFTAIVRKAARKLSGADGATFVLRDGEQCYYVDEDAIGPLWRGSRFSLKSCISGWAMLNKSSVVLEDIYQDPRIPADAYRPTFVKSLVMVPIRQDSPIGAIGAYWARNQKASDETVQLLQALADSTSIAFENLDLYNKLQGKISELESANSSLVQFAWAAAHDLREPCRSISNLTQLIQKKYGQRLEGAGKELLQSLLTSSQRLYGLIGGIMSLTGVQANGPTARSDLNEVASDVQAHLHTLIVESDSLISTRPLPTLDTDPKLVSIVLQNLLTNSLKFRSEHRRSQIEISSEATGPHWIVKVKDNGIGIPEEFHTQVFTPFRRLHPYDRYSGSGLGLSIAKKAVELLNGKIWIDPAVKDGACVCFSLPANGCAQVS